MFKIFDKAFRTGAVTTGYPRRPAKLSPGAELENESISQIEPARTMKPKM